MDAKSFSLVDNSCKKVSEAKVVKLSTQSSKYCSPKNDSGEHRYQCLSSTPNSIQTNRNVSIDELDITKAVGIDLYVIRDFKYDNLKYGSLQVTKGEYLKLICDSEGFYFVENKNGEQGYIPIDVAVDMDELYKRVQKKQMNSTIRITSL
jgi:hypothetical protein